MHLSAPAGVQGVACITDGADTLMYRDRDASSIVTWWLVDRHVLATLSQRRALAGIDPPSLGH
jgi:hypothetical protein